MGNKNSTNQEEWMRLNEAAEHIGVHFTTLRRWSDAGKVPCFKTPGGWRRYKESDLNDFLQKSQKGEVIKSNPVGTDTAKPEIIKEIQQLGIREEPWCGQISQENRQLMSKYGRRLIGSLMQYASRNNGGELHLQQGKKLAHSYGHLCHQSGLSTVQTLQAFMMIRHSIIDSLCEAGVVVEDSREDTWKLFQRINHFLDVVLLTILEYFQEQPAIVSHSFE